VAQDGSCCDDACGGASNVCSKTSCGAWYNCYCTGQCNGIHATCESDACLPTWEIGAIAGGCGAVVLLCVIGCCGRNIRAACCPPKPTATYIQMPAAAAPPAYRPPVYASSTPRFCPNCGVKGVAGMACTSCGAA